MDILTKNGVETPKEELIERIEIEGSPFTLVKIDREIFIGMGQYRLTEVFNIDEKSVEELVAETEKISWNRLIQVIMILQESKFNLNKEK